MYIYIYIPVEFFKFSLDIFEWSRRFYPFSLLFMLRSVSYEIFTNTEECFLKSLSYIWNGGSSDDKESACNVGDPGSVSGLGTSPGEGNGNPLQYSFLENPMDREAWGATVPGITRSWT